MIAISKDCYEKLNTNLVTRTEIHNYFCKHLIRRGVWKGSCEAYLPVLKILMTEELDSADDPRGLILWRLKEYGVGNLDVWPKSAHQSPKPYHSTVSVKEAVKRIKGS